jgi:UPF0755 protein
MRRALIAVAVLLVVVALALGGAYLAAERWYRAPLAGLTAPAIIEIAPGEPLGRVAERLAERRGLLEHPRLFAWLARRDGKAARVQAGEYLLAPGTSPAGLLDQWVEGRVLLHPVTLVEGWTTAAVLESLHANPLLKRAVASADPALMERLGAPGVAAEGEFFPDTYLVPKGATDLEILRLAHARLEDRLASAWLRHRADLPLATPYQALILASIIEKETGDPEERPHIAAVFVNRLRRGMRLQTDPTVIYGLGAAYDGRLHHRDLATDTPYNTYTRDGLPPTPIALAGAAALEAAVAPADSDDLYFVATGRGDGRHEFSRTLEAHNAAVARYLERLRSGGGRQ